VASAGLTILALPIALPLAGALLVALTRGRLADAVAVLAALGALVAALALVLAHGMTGAALSLGGLPVVDRMAGHPVPLFGLAIDPLSSVVLLGSVAIGFACMLYSVGYVSPANRETPASADRREYWVLMLLFIAAMSGLVTSPTLLQMFVFWEITTVCSWALIGFYDCESGALAAARKAFLLTAAGGLALFAAALALLALTHSAGFDALSRLPAGAQGAAALLTVLLLAGAWAKSGQVPFHTWLPSAMVAPSPVSAYLHAASLVNAGVYLVLRLAFSNAPGVVQVAAADPGGAALPILLPAAHALPAMLPGLIGTMAVITLLVTLAQFFFQDDLKRLLALSTMGQLALVLLGAALGLAGSARAMQGATLQILAGGVGKALLFLSVGTLSYAAGTRHIRDLSGVLTRAPVAAAGFLIGALTVTGVPPFAGFWSKLLLVTGAVSLGGVGIAAGAFVVLESLVAFAWFLWVGQKVFLGEPSAAVAAMGRRPAAMEAALVLLMVLCLVITLVGMPLATAAGPGRFGG
jgi:hydrogenase-4 component D